MVPAPAFLQSTQATSDDSTTASTPYTSAVHDSFLKLKAAYNNNQAASTTSSSSSSSRLSAPLRLTNAFEKRGIHHFNHTPAIGTEFEKGQLDLAELLQRAEDDEEADELLQELAVMSESHLFSIFVTTSTSTSMPCPPSPNPSTLPNKYWTTGGGLERHPRPLLSRERRERGEDKAGKRWTKLRGSSNTRCSF